MSSDLYNKGHDGAIKQHHKKGTDMLVAFGNIELDLPEELLLECHHQGQCDVDCAYWAEQIDWTQQPPHEELVKALAEYGAWSDEELAVFQDTRERVLWLAAGQYQDELMEE
jgi:hypothetical protein